MMAALDSTRTIAVIGTGTMGAGIAQVAAASGHPVLLYDAFAGAAEKAVAGTAKVLDGLVAKGRMTQEARDTLIGRLACVGSLADLAPASLVVEAVKEDLGIKRALFSELEAIVAPDAILATNTSSLSITAIAAALQRPERFAGLHFFNPAPLMPLVEVVSGLATSETVSAILMATAAAWGKSPVAARSTPGFIVNRVARPFYAEGLRVLQEGGGDVATLDAIMRDGGGFRMGPFELMDLIGHDVNFAVTSSVHASYFGDPRFSPSIIQQELVEAGRLGRKSGRGFYDYAADAAKPVPATLPEAPKPGSLEIVGDLGSSLAERIAAAGIVVRQTPSQSAGHLLIDGIMAVPTDGTSATERAASLGHDDLVCFDLVLDWEKSPRIAIAAAAQARKGAAAAVAGLFQALGKSVSPLDDIPGLIVMRTVAMLANEAAETALHRVATPSDIDVAMMKGTNYPRGPLAWADQLGAKTVLTVLDNLARTYGEDRYRASSLLRRVAARGGRFHEAIA
jgi:3-hydroxybutyryl-CoA dehydrogenase